LGPCKTDLEAAISDGDCPVRECPGIGARLYARGRTPARSIIRASRKAGTAMSGFDHCIKLVSIADALFKFAL
jgi:hypothetical protein